MLKGKDVVIISSIEWGSLWQGAQEIASRLGEAGNRVLYIENVGIRSPGLRDVGQAARARARDCFSLEDCVKSYEAIYSTLTSAARG